MANRRRKTDSLILKFLKFLFASKAAVLVIALNVAVFVYFERSTFAKTLFDMVVLYPGNLLQGKFWC